jgi:hypothetical protein
VPGAALPTGGNPGRANLGYIVIKRLGEKQLRVRAFKKIVFLVVLGSALLFGGVSWASLREGLIGYWPYDGDMLDYSGLNNHGTAFGNPNFVRGLVGSAALNFDGSDYVRMDSVADDITSNDITLSAWVKTTDSAGDWFSCNTATGGNVALWAITGGRAAMYDGAYEGQSSTFVTNGTWHMLTYIRKGPTGYTYVDGAQENTHTANFNFSPTDRWSIAQEWDGDNPSDFLAGTVDEVAIWDRALTAEEVAFLYNNGKGIPPTEGAYVQITASGGEIPVTEGGAAGHYEVVLRSEPAADVEITATPGDEQIDLGHGPGLPAILIFSPSNWNAPQTVEVTAVDDNVYEGKSPHTTVITHSAVSTDENYDGIAIASVEVSVIDNELTCGDWGYLPGDLNRDCYVDLLDFAILAQQWLEIGGD